MELASLISILKFSTAENECKFMELEDALAEGFRASWEHETPGVVECRFMDKTDIGLPSWHDIEQVAKQERWREIEVQDMHIEDLHMYGIERECASAAPGAEISASAAAAKYPELPRPQPPATQPPAHVPQPKSRGLPNKPGPWRGKFIPNPNCWVQVQFRHLKDKHNEREARRKLKKAAAEAAATGSASSSAAATGSASSSAREGQAQLGRPGSRPIWDTW